MKVTGTPAEPGDAYASPPPALFVHVEAQGNLLAIKPSTVRLSKSGGGRRGSVTTFSRQSRLRLLRKTARMRPNKAVFLTLTYPKRYPTQKGAKRHLRAFLERIRRRYPKSSAVWRLELQERGAPHFHLIFFGLPFIHWRKVRLWWHEIIAEFVDEHPPRIKIEMIWSPNGVMYYVAKYCAKPTEPPAEPESSGVFPVSLSTTHICTHQRFDLAKLRPALALQSEIIRSANADNESGRVWGIFNKEFIPYAPAFYTVVEQVTWVGFEDAKIALHEIFEPVSTRTLRGAAIFTQGAYWYAEQIMLLLLPDIPAKHGGFWIGAKHDARHNTKVRHCRARKRINVIQIHAINRLRQRAPAATAQ